MRAKSRSNAQRHQKQRRAYHEANPTCEVRKYLSGPIVEEFKASWWEWQQTEVHHISGRGRYGEAVENYITLAKPIHDWLTSGTNANGSNWYPGFVICCFSKKQKSELDWELLGRIRGVCLPGWLETDKFVDTCGLYPEVDRYRRELLEGA